MTHRFQLDWALLPTGWTRDVVATVSTAGMVTSIEAGCAAPAPTERIAGFVLPGMANAHSHAFQRALAGGAERRASSRDSFWTWRSAMYALANRLRPDELQIVATQLFIEMLKAGYTSVGEFHYLHRTLDGAASGPGRFALWDAVIAAARAAGIGLSFLPTLYQTSDFGGAPLKPEQSRFQLDVEDYLDAIAARIGAERDAAGSPLRIGAAFHSLRAVPLDTLRQAAARLAEIDSTMPVHIHVAEQAREVKSCVSATGLRPIELLLGTGLVNDRWCLVHCTHATPAELAGIAASGAAVCVSISTEANLGDGFFDTLRFARADGRLCIGSDSQSTVDPAEELRWLEYQQRLRRKRRMVLATAAEPHTGTQLWCAAAREGARALGQPAGAIAVGQRADWIALDPDHPAIAGAAPEAMADRLIFAGGRAAIRDCLVAGRRVIKGGRHAAEAASAETYAALMRRFAAA